MSSPSLLDIARFREMNSDMFEKDTPAIKQKGTKIKEDDMFKRKLRRLLTLLMKYETESKDTNQKDIQAMIHLLREVIPHMQKQERVHLEKVYKELDMGDNKKK